MMNKQHPLVGETIESIWLATDRQAIRFLLSSGASVTARADGDCCSITWIESLSMPALGLPATVTDAKDIEMPDLGDMKEREVVAYYGFRIETDKGEIVIDYRNESNGYYGGCLVWPEEHFYGGGFGQNVSSEEWREVTEDVVGSVSPDANEPEQPS